MKLAELARILEAECRGDGTLEIAGVAGIEEAGPDQVTFVANLKYAVHARATRAAAIIVPKDFPEIDTLLFASATPISPLPRRSRSSTSSRSIRRGFTPPR